MIVNIYINKKNKQTNFIDFSQNKSILKEVVQDDYDTQSILTTCDANDNKSLPKESESFTSIPTTTTMTMNVSTTNIYTNESTPLDEKIHSASNRLKKYPTLNYLNLYNALLNLIEIIPTLQLSPVGNALIHTMTCLAPFLSDEIVESLPYTIALTLTTFPKDLQKTIIDSLCNNFLPIACKSILNFVFCFKLKLQTICLKIYKYI